MRLFPLCYFTLTIRFHTWYLSFSDWLISLSTILSRPIHSVAKGKISNFLWPSNVPLCKCTRAFVSTHLTHGHSGSFQILATVNNAAINIGVHIFSISNWFFRYFLEYTFGKKLIDLLFKDLFISKISLIRPVKSDNWFWSWKFWANYPTKLTFLV